MRLRRAREALPLGSLAELLHEELEAFVEHLVLAGAGGDAEQAVALTRIKWSVGRGSAIAGALPLAGERLSAQGLGSLRPPA